MYCLLDTRHDFNRYTLARIVYQIPATTLIELYSSMQVIAYSKEHNSMIEYFNTSKELKKTFTLSYSLLDEICLSLLWSIIFEKQTSRLFILSRDFFLRLLIFLYSYLSFSIYVLLETLPVLLSLNFDLHEALQDDLFLFVICSVFGTSVVGNFDEFWSF